MDALRLSFQTRSQSLAQRVWRCIASPRHDSMKDDSFRAEYAQRALELGSLLRLSGLAQTLAYLMRSDKDARRQLARDFCEVLELGSAEVVAELPACEYAIHARRALTAADYFKRFAESELGAERGGTGDPDIATGAER